MNVVPHETQLTDDGVLPSFSNRRQHPRWIAVPPIFGWQFLSLSNPIFQRTNLTVSLHTLALLLSAATSLAYLFRTGEPRQGLGDNYAN